MVIFILLCSSSVVSVDAASMWSRTYGGAGDDCAFSVVKTFDGGYAIAGYTTSWGAGGRDFWWFKTDSNGVMEWSRIYGGTGYDWAFSLVETSDGGYAIAGAWDYSSLWEFNNFMGGDFWLVKTDADGVMEWDRKYGGTGNDMARSLVATPDGGYAIAGYSAPLYNFWLVKTDALGNMQWNQTYGGGVPMDFLGSCSLVATSDGGYALAGGSLLVKTDALGNMQWNQTYGVDAQSLVETSDGGYAMVGWHYFNGQDFLWIKTDANGSINLTWNMTYGGTGVENGYALLQSGDGGYVLTGSTNSFGAGGNDIWLVKTDEFGYVPEYSSWLIPALVLTATAFIIINKKKLLRRSS